MEPSDHARNGHDPAGERHLQRAAHERGAAEVEQFVARELEPDREEQEHHAEIRQRVHEGEVVDQRESARTDQHSGGDESDRRGDPQALEREQHEQRESCQEQQLAQGREVLVHRLGGLRRSRA